MERIKRLFGLCMLMIIMIVSTVYAQPYLLDGLTVYYDFGYTNESLINDNVFGYDTNEVGGIVDVNFSTTGCILGACMHDYEGADYIFDDSPLKFNPDNFTISLWFKDESIESRVKILGFSPSTASNRMLLSLWDVGDLRYQYYDVNGTERIGMYSNTTGIYNSTTHVVISSERGKKTKIYIDGVLDSITDAPTVSLNYDEAYPLYIGAWNFNNVAGTKSYIGWFDEFGIWNRTLTEQEINHLYNNDTAKNFSLFESSIVANFTRNLTDDIELYYPFDGEFDYRNFASVSGQYDGILNNPSKEIFHQSNCAVFGCSVFNESDRYLKIGDYNLSDSYSILFWAEPDSSTYGGVFTSGRVSGKYFEYDTYIRNDRFRADMFFDGNTSEESLTYSITDANVFNHYAIIYNSSTRDLSLYVNNVRVDNETVGVPAIPSKRGTNGTSNSIARIGQRFETNYFLIGKIDELIVYSRTLKIEEIETFYNGTTLRGLLPSSPIGQSFIRPKDSGVRSGDFNISWDEAIDYNNDTVNYVLSVFNSSGVKVYRQVTNKSSIVTALTDNVSYSDDLTIYLTSFDDTGLNYTVSIQIFYDGSQPISNLTFPTSATKFWSNLTVAGYCNDTDLDVISVSINDTNFTTVSSNPESFEYEYTGSKSYENLLLNITCTDESNNTGSTVYNLNFDLITPSCSPLPDVTVSEGQSYQWNFTCIDDLNLYSLNITCKGFNYSYYRNNINLTNFTFVNITPAITQDSTCVIIAQDGHTKKDIRDVLNEYNVKEKVKGKISVPNNNRLLTVINDSQYENIEFIYDTKDRIRFKVKKTENHNSKKKKSFPDEYEFIVKGNRSISHIKNDMFDSWFVVDNMYWIDFETDSHTIQTITKVSDLEYVVKIETWDSELEFNSIGVVNTNRYEQDFSVKVDYKFFEMDFTSLEGVILFIGLLFFYGGMLFMAFRFGNIFLHVLALVLSLFLTFAFIQLHWFFALIFFLTSIFIFAFSTTRE